MRLSVTQAGWEQPPEHHLFEGHENTPTTSAVARVKPAAVTKANCTNELSSIFLERVCKRELVRDGKQKNEIR